MVDSVLNIAEGINEKYGIAIKNMNVSQIIEESMLSTLRRDNGVDPSMKRIEFYIVESKDKPNDDENKVSLYMRDKITGKVKVLRLPFAKQLENQKTLSLPSKGIVGRLLSNKVDRIASWQLSDGTVISAVKNGNGELGLGNNDMTDLNQINMVQIENMPYLEADSKIHNRKFMEQLTIPKELAPKAEVVPSFENALSQQYGDLFNAEEIMQVKDKSVIELLKAQNGINPEVNRVEFYIANINYIEDNEKGVGMYMRDSKTGKIRPIRMPLDEKMQNDKLVDLSRSVQTSDGKLYPSYADRLVSWKLVDGTTVSVFKDQNGNMKFGRNDTNKPYIVNTIDSMEFTKQEMVNGAIEEDQR